MQTTFLPFPLPDADDQGRPQDEVRRNRGGRAVAVNACTLAIAEQPAMHLAWEAVGPLQGVRVITTPMTFCSTVHVIEHLGARPVLVDALPDTLNLDPAQVARAITPRTRGILPVSNLYGHPCDMAPILDLAARHWGRRSVPPKVGGSGGQASGGRLLQPSEHPHHPHQVSLAHGRAGGETEASPEKRLGHRAAHDLAALEHRLHVHRLPTPGRFPWGCRWNAAGQTQPRRT